MLNRLYTLITGKRGKESLRQVFANPPHIETPRLLLRKMLVSDAMDMYEYSREPIITQYLTWHPHTSYEQTRDYLKYLQKKYADGSFYDWGIQYKADGKFIGTCGFTSIDLANNSAEVGYVLSNKYWGAGLMPEAVMSVLHFGFTTFGFNKIVGKFMNGNDNSCKVMQKCGMTFERTMKNSMFIKGEYKTIHIFSVNKERFMGT